MTDIPAEAMTVPLDRPDPDSEVGGYVAATGHVSPDYGARVRAAAVFSQLDETLAPQLLVDAIAATPPGSALDSSRADALALLGEAARDSFQLPREGLSLVCEVCGDVAVIQGRRRRWAAYVAWAQLDMGASDDFEDFIPRLLDLPSGNESTAGEVADLRRLRFDQQYGTVRRCSGDGRIASAWISPQTPATSDSGGRPVDLRKCVFPRPPPTAAVRNPPC